MHANCSVMNSLLTLLLITLIGPARSTQNFTKIFELEQLKLPQPFFLEVYGRRVFLSFCRPSNYSLTIAWLSKENMSSNLRTLHAFPSMEMQVNENECNALQDVRGLKVDVMGRLWAVDNGLKECGPKLWIFDLTNQDSVVMAYHFPRNVALAKRWMSDLVVDHSEDGFYSYIADSNNGHTSLIVFNLATKSSWRVDINQERIETFAISPLKNRKYLYFSGQQSNYLHSVRISDLRAGFKNPTVTLVGNKTAPSRRLAIDINGILYFDLHLERTLASWNTHASFKEKKLLKDETTKTYYPFAFAFDEFENLMLVTIHTSKLKFMQLDTGVYSGPYSFDDNCQCPQILSSCESGPLTKPIDSHIIAPCKCQDQTEAYQNHSKGSYRTTVGAFTHNEDPYKTTTNNDSKDLYQTTEGYFEDPDQTTEGYFDQEQTEIFYKKAKVFPVFLICSNGCTLLLMGAVIICLYLRLRRALNTIKQMKKSMNVPVRDPITQDEGLYDDVGPINFELANMRSPYCNDESDLYAEIDPQHV